MKIARGAIAFALFDIEALILTGRMETKMRMTASLLFGACFLVLGAACVEIGTERDGDDAGISDGGGKTSDAGAEGPDGSSDEGDASDAEPGHIPEELVGTWSISTSGEYVSGMTEYVFASAGTYTVSTLLDTKDQCFFTYTEGVANAVGNQLTLSPTRTRHRKSVSCDTSTPTEDLAVAEPETYSWSLRQEDSWTFLDLTNEERTVSLSKDE